MKNISSYACTFIKGIKPLFITLFVSFCLTGCATYTYQLRDTKQINNFNAAPVVHIPVPEEIYVELPQGSTRYAEFEIHIGRRLLGNIVGIGIGAWAGYSNAVSGIPANSVAAVTPWVAAAIKTARPIMNSTIGQKDAR